MNTGISYQPPLVIGSPEHKELLCSFFTKTSDPYKPADLKWPKLNAASSRDCFTMNAHEQFGDISPREFVPSIARAVLTTLPRHGGLN